MAYVLKAIPELTPDDARINKLIDAIETGANPKPTFAASLVKQYISKGKLTEKQWPWVDKLSAPPEPVAKHGVPGAHEAFSSVTKGDNPRVYLAALAVNAGTSDPFVLSLRPAPVAGSNAGFLYVYRREGAKAKAGDYVGKVSADDWFFPIKDAEPFAADVTALLEEFGLDEVEVLKTSGLITGSCANCGRRLTHKNSVAFGIGPTCSEYLGLKDQWLAAAE